MKSNIINKTDTESLQEVITKTALMREQKRGYKPPHSLLKLVSVQKQPRENLR